MIHVNTDMQKKCVNINQIKIRRIPHLPLILVKMRVKQRKKISSENFAIFHDHNSQPILNGAIPSTPHSDTILTGHKKTRV